MEVSKYELNDEEWNELIKTIKNYTNLFKALSILDPKAAEEFRKKQEFYHNQLHTEHKEHSSNCCANKLDKKCKIILFSLYSK
jgi:hypothetical protein